MYTVNAGGAISQTVNRQLMEANGMPNHAAAGVAAAIEALDANYVMDPVDARLAVILHEKGTAVSTIASTFTVSAALPTWSYPAPTWTWP